MTDDNAESQTDEPTKKEVELAVRNYLELLRNGRSKAKVRTPDEINADLDDAKLKKREADVLQELKLAKRILELGEELRIIEESAAVDPEQIEADFVKLAKTYGDQNGYSYLVWREVGVPAGVLKRAGYKEQRKYSP